MQESSNSIMKFACMEEMLILAVKKRPLLWNYRDCHPSKHSTIAKNKLWVEIETIINPNKENSQYTAKFFKNKWKNLLDTYKVYLAKEKNRSETKEPAKPRKPWRFMEQMSFIKETVDFGKKRTANNFPKDNSDNSLPCDSDSGSEADKNTENPQKKQKIDDDIEKILAALNMPIPVPQINLPILPKPTETEIKDEISQFCLTIDKKLRKLDTKKASLAMYKIYEILYKIENNFDV